MSTGFMLPVYDAQADTWFADVGSGLIQRYKTYHEALEATEIAHNISHSNAKFLTRYDCEWLDKP